MKRRKISLNILILLSALLLNTVGGTLQAAYAAQDFVESNIEFFADNLNIDCKSGSAAKAKSSDNAETVFRFLVANNFASNDNKPYSAVQAAGFLGNFKTESGFDPAIIQRDRNGQPQAYDATRAMDSGVTGYAFGLAQWDGGRRVALLKFAQEQGADWRDLVTQLDYLKKELDGAEGEGLAKDTEFSTTTDPKVAAVRVRVVFERAGVPSDETRQSAAQGYYDKFKNLAATASGSPSSSASCSSGGTVGNGQPSAFAGDGAIIYNQCDRQWGSNPYGNTGKTTCSSGCGPSAMAMVITALTGKKVTPTETIAYANTRNLYIDGAGSSWTTPNVLAEHWGLKASAVGSTVDAVNEVLRAGGMVVLSGTGTAPFTSSGHYIAIRGVTADGSWQVFDSAGRDPNIKYKPREVMANAATGSMRAITKP